MSKTFKYHPKKIHADDTQWYCDICRYTYPRNHHHFDFSIQSTVDSITRINADRVALQDLSEWKLEEEG